MVVVFALLLGCSQKKENKEQKITPAAKKIKKAPAKIEISRVFTTAKYSDGKDWQNGINIKNPGQFFINIAKKGLKPIKIGDKLQFASAGEAVVKKIGRQDNLDYATIFVTVDKNLDPAKDGNPNPIRITSIEVQPCRYSKPGEWLNGISLAKPGLFFLTIERMDQTPIKVGDRLKFGKSGESIVTQVSRQDREDNFANIYIKVDKPLDPTGDGYPNIIGVIITN